ncbi:MAG TPA: CoA pyrophosphatase [Pelomicrobium sp.]|nr:CoA pyrophosphatase [Pelomicrobium sp.]
MDDLEESLIAGVAALTRERILARLARLAARPWLAGDDLDKLPALGACFTAAAVLVPLVERPHGLQVLLTQRTAHLNDHAGQVSFPGGRVDPGDVSREATALREAEEEIGLARERIEILGRLPEYHTVTGFSVTPVVGYLAPPFDLRLDAFEVAEVFEVPLAFLMDPANHQRHSFVYQGRSRSYYAMPYEGRFIWGATAAMLINLQRALLG